MSTVLALAFVAPTAFAGPAQSVRINGALAQPPLAGDVSDGYAFAPAGARIVFRADVPADELELYSAPADASAPAVRLAPGVPITGFAAAFGRAAYLGYDTPGRLELFS